MLLLSSWLRRSRFGRQILLAFSSSSASMYKVVRLTVLLLAFAAAPCFALSFLSSFLLFLSHTQSLFSLSLPLPILPFPFLLTVSSIKPIKASYGFSSVKLRFINFRASLIFSCPQGQSQTAHYPSQILSLPSSEKLKITYPFFFPTPATSESSKRNSKFAMATSFKFSFIFSFMPSIICPSVYFVKPAHELVKTLYQPKSETAQTQTPKSATQFVRQFVRQGGGGSNA